ncbi:hypothetical protein J0X19_23210 [Hymenobacter sp. BT186]|uniref:Prolyl-tRNA synthetase n=1 Tax=Hymenobacter telluris TaxID=2816474 RepID=A0A939F0F9_9BACT|nr:hypothetical protein [Hymenobacter telluris]MBO0360888.1 hypothetical protein [Hymenobacter telluris]MBW3376917.1 hypothetical protein [Hymenobacter norwichensis]
MKNSLSHLLPALALLTLGGCAGTSALSTTENDGVYYSSKDRTVQNATASAAGTTPAEELQSDGDISNPDYAAEGQRSSTVTESTEYYDDDYAYSSRIRRFHQPYYRGFGYGYNDFVYADPYWYGGSPYYGSAFYDPFWGPGYGYGGSFVNINIGFGSPWGWGYNPWRYGRGFGYGGLYDGYGYGYGGYGGYGYGGFGGYNNYYINNYYGGGNYGGGVIGTAPNVRYGPRTSRSAEAGTAGRTSPGTGNAIGSRSRATGGVADPTGGRAASDGLVGNGSVQPNGRGRTRTTEAGTAAGVAPAVMTNDQIQTGRVTRSRDNNATVGQNTDKMIDQINSGSSVNQPGNVYESRGRRRMAEVTGGTGTDAAAPQYSQPRRSRFSELNTNPSQSSGQSQDAAQPTRRQRVYQAPQQSYETPQRTYQAPQRTYEAPTRSYEAPSRSYEAPSRSSAPAGGGGDGGGGRGRGRN